MNNEFRFSVCMSVYKNDDPQHLKEAINSVINQTLVPNEIVIVVDGPVSNEIKDILEFYRNSFPLIKILYQKENKGLGIALAIGTEACSYDWIARMDSDDISVPNRFELQVDYLKKHNDIDVMGGIIAEFKQDIYNVVDYRVVPCDNSDIYKFMRTRDGFNHMTVFIKKKKLKDVGGYLDWHFNEDTYLWIRMMKENAIFANIPEVLVYARVDNGLYDRRGGWKYLKSCLGLQLLRYKFKQISVVRFLMNCLVKSFIILAPASFRELVYKSVLRKEQIY